MGAAETFGSRLKGLREEKGLTQAQLADELKVSRASIGFYEKAERTPDIDFLVSVSDYFNVSCDWLLGNAETMTADNEAIYKRLGLNDTAIYNLEECFGIRAMSPLLRMDFSAAVNELIGSDDFLGLIVSFGSALSSVKKINSTDDFGLKIHLPPDFDEYDKNAVMAQMERYDELEEKISKLLHERYGHNVRISSNSDMANMNIFRAEQAFRDLLFNHPLIKAFKELEKADYERDMFYDEDGEKMSDNDKTVFLKALEKAWEEAQKEGDLNGKHPQN